MKSKIDEFLTGQKSGAVVGCDIADGRGDVAKTGIFTDYEWSLPAHTKATFDKYFKDSRAQIAEQCTVPPSVLKGGACELPPQTRQRTLRDSIADKIRYHQNQAEQHDMLVSRLVEAREKFAALLDTPIGDISELIR